MKVYANIKFKRAACNQRGEPGYIADKRVYLRRSQKLHNPAAWGAGVVSRADQPNDSGLYSGRIGPLFAVGAEHKGREPTLN